MRPYMTYLPSVGTLQLVECRLVHLSGNENLGQEANLCTDVGMVQGRKILVTGGGGYFGHKLGNELKKLGAVVVLFDISWPLDDVVYEQMECFPVET